MSKTTKIIAGVFLGLIILVGIFGGQKKDVNSKNSSADNGSSAGWRYLKWGMSPAEVGNLLKANNNGSLTPKKLFADYGCAYFLITPDHSLEICKNDRPVVNVTKYVNESENAEYYFYNNSFFNKSIDMGERLTDDEKTAIIAKLKDKYSGGKQPYKFEYQYMSDDQLVITANKASNFSVVYADPQTTKNIEAERAANEKKIQDNVTKQSTDKL